MRFSSLHSRVLAGTIKRSSRALGRARWRWVQLDEPSLLQEARARARLDDFGDPAFRAGLQRLLCSYDTESRLSPIGRLAARQDTLRLLCNRLRLRDDRQRHPQIAAERIAAPVIVTGLPRTGTTLLHGLLAQDPGNRAPLLWEMLFPYPTRRLAAQRPGRRIAQAERRLRWFHRLTPELRRIHAVDARQPEECLVITSHSFMSFQFQTSHNVPSYQRWLEAQDLTPAYVVHREFLQQLQWRAPRRTWVLKAPAHVFGLRALFATYPDARVVFTHRDPLEVVASVASLHCAARGAFSDSVDPLSVGVEVCQRWGLGIDRAVQERDAGVVPADRCTDVFYDHLVRDPITCVRDIYARLERELTARTEARMRRFLAGHPKDAFGRHQYTLARFGLDPDWVRDRFRNYRERFGL
jgi:hypothetical protein